MGLNSAKVSCIIGGVRDSAPYLGCSIGSVTPHILSFDRIIPSVCTSIRLIMSMGGNIFLWALLVVTLIGF